LRVLAVLLQHSVYIPQDYTLCTALYGCRTEVTQLITPYSIIRQNYCYKQAT